jgi:hypothetical protein
MAQHAQTEAATRPRGRATRPTRRLTCETKGRTADECESACQCVADAILRSGQAGLLGEGDLDPERKAALKRMGDACMGR